jgi:hypothetical protein
LVIALVPFGVVTVMLTLPALPLGETALSTVELLTVTSVALADPKLTLVAPVKLVPVIVTSVPPVSDPFFGESLVTVGA